MSQISEAALRSLARQTGSALLARKWRAATAESCTGGWVAKCLTDISGSSQWFERGFVTYSNAAKEQSIDVAPETLGNFGAVSSQVVEQMAVGALRRSGADVSVAITGVAGPDGGSADKPVGLVWFGLAQTRRAPLVQKHQFSGDREAIRRASVATALRMLIEAAQS